MRTIGSTRAKLTKAAACLCTAAGIAVWHAAAVALPDAAAMEGTWECHGPGQRSAHTPPILFLSPPYARDAGGTSMYVDGFGGALSGEATVTPEADAVSIAAAGGTLVVRDIAEHGRTARMSVSRQGAGRYVCYRLPRTMRWTSDDAPSGRPAPSPASRVYYQRPRSYEPIEVPGLN